MTPLRIVAVSTFALTAALATGAFADSLTITPAPAKVVRAEGTFTLSASTRIHVARGDIEAKGVALQLADLIQRSRGFRPKVVEGPPAADAIVLTREGPAGEAYKLDINAKGATIAAAKRAGLFYGAMSLWQLATPDEAKGPVALLAASIEDAPRFAWRGLMVDSARHYQSLDTLKAVIDAMAAHKLNTFHWHLVDDQGWRLEIKKYPKLTQVAAWRRNPGAAVNYPKYGGFYTQDQARELVAYAAARNITVVPEIETPGHALAPIVAYPQLGTAPPDASKMGDWGIFPWLYNTDDATFAFLDDVLNEVMDIFPSTFIHVGGDEAIKDQWKASPKVQAKIKELGLKDEHELQSWFIQRVGKSLEKRGRRLIGWDEILEGGLAPNATVMSWRGIDGAIAAAKQGHDTVLSPHPVLYLDHRQSASAEEPTGRGHISSLKDVYAFDPAPVQLTPDERKHILGVQANVWTEHMQTAVALFSIPFFLIDGLFTRGEFTVFDARQTANALLHYGWGTPAFVLARILSPAFFARGDTKGPMRFALISVAVNIGLGLALFPVMGVPGLAAATSAASWINVLQMALTLRKRGDYAPSAAAWGKIIRVLGASVALGLILAAISRGRAALEAPILAMGIGSAKELAILATCALAAGLYPVLLLLSGGVTLAEARTVLRRGTGR